MWLVERSGRVEHDGSRGQRRRLGARRGVDPVSRRDLGCPAAAQTVGRGIHNSLMHRLRDDRRVRSAPVAADRRGRDRSGIRSGRMARERARVVLGVGARSSSRTSRTRRPSRSTTRCFPSSFRSRSAGVSRASGRRLGYVGSIVGVLLVMPFFNGMLSHVARGGRRDGRASVHRAVHRRMAAACRRSCRQDCCSCSSRCRCLSFAATTIQHRVERRSTGAAHFGTSARRFATRANIQARSGSSLRRSFYQDAIGTIVGFMTLYAVKAVGFDKGSEITLLPRVDDSVDFRQLHLRPPRRSVWRPSEV